MLDQEIKFYEGHLEELLEQYPGKIVLIKENKLVGTFDTDTEAITEWARQFGLTSFLVRRVQRFQDEANVPAYSLGILNGSSQHTVSGSTI